MMFRKMPVSLLPLMLLWPTISLAGLFGPSNYDECITDSMRGVSSDVAARAIIESCRNLFPEPRRAAEPQASLAPAPASAPVEDSAAPDAIGELARLQHAARIFGSAYRVTIDNGNPNLTLTEVTIAAWDDGDPAAGRREYSEPVQIAPQSSAMVKYTVHYRGDESRWNRDVVAARGVE